MSERYTAEDARQAFHRIRQAFGIRHADDYPWRDPKRIGAWTLDSAPAYGGFVIHEQDNDAGGVGTPFGSERRNAREFCEWVHDIFGAFEVAERVGGRAPTTPMEDDECPHVRHMHIDHGREPGDERRYVTHIHAASKSTATMPAYREHAHGEIR